MTNESINKNSKNYVKLLTLKKFKRNKRKRHFSKSIISILQFLIKLLLLIILLLLFLLIKSQLRKSYNFIKDTSNIENIKNIDINYSFYFENKIKGLQTSSIEWPLPNQIKFKPFMKKKDLMGFLLFMKPNLTYFEFGSGGSTNIASYYKLKVYSVESDVLWHNKLKNSNIKASFITVDLKTSELGYPGENTTIEDWKKYFQAYDCKYNADIILIDGRFRVVCGLDIFPKIRNDTLILVHDYENRKEYHILEKYYIKVRKWDILSAFFKNPNVTSIPQDVYNSYMYDKK